MATIVLSYDKLRAKYNEVCYRNKLDKYLHSGQGNMLCIIIAIAAVPAFIIAVMNPQIALGFREVVVNGIDMFIDNLVQKYTDFVDGSIITMVISFAVMYFLLRNIFYTFFDFLFTLLLLPIILYFALGSIAHISVYTIPLIAIAWALTICYETKHKSRIISIDSAEGSKLRVGLDGEKMALKRLSKLGDDCHIFTSLRVPRGQKEAEMDLVVGNPLTGFTIIEVKNYMGKIKGDLSDPELIHNRSKKLNPVVQVERHQYFLCSYFSDKNIRVPVKRCVYFVNPRLEYAYTDEYKVEEKSCPIFAAWEKKKLFKYIYSGEECDSEGYEQALQVLSELAASSWHNND